MDDDIYPETPRLRCEMRHSITEYGLWLNGYGFGSRAEEVVGLKINTKKQDSQFDGPPYSPYLH